MDKSRPYAEMGARIKSKRLERGWTVDELRDEMAKLPGKANTGTGSKKVSTSAVSSWENGKSRPDRYLTRLAQVLGVSVEWLEFGEAGPAQASDDELAHALEVIRQRGLDVVERRHERHVDRAFSGVDALAPPMVTGRPKRRSK